MISDISLRHFMLCPFLLFWVLECLVSLREHLQNQFCFRVFSQIEFLAFTIFVQKP
jgi:hypothetical protein